jgi:hypothetical protein
MRRGAVDMGRAEIDGYLTVTPRFALFPSTGSPSQEIPGAIASQISHCYMGQAICWAMSAQIPGAGA